jgi:hypothetical protein
MLKKIFFLLPISLLSDCIITSNKDYYVNDKITPSIYSNCSFSDKNYKSKYYIPKNTKIKLRDLEEINQKQLLVLPNNIKIIFKNRVVEKTANKIKTKDINNNLKVYHIKELYKND